MDKEYIRERLKEMEVEAKRIRKEVSDLYSTGLALRTVAVGREAEVLEKTLAEISGASLAMSGVIGTLERIRKL